MANDLMTTTTKTTTTTTTGLAAIDQEQLRTALDRLIRMERPRLRRLWAYFKNPMRVCGAADPGPAGSERPYRQAQEWGLPARITGACSGGEPFADCARGALSRKEVVIENDIGWRIDTMVDYLFGKPLVVSSAAPDPARRERIGRLLRMIIANSGGIGFLQQLALFGSVYGYVDVLVKAVPCDTSTKRPSGCGTSDLGQAPVTETPAGGDHQSSPDGHRTSETRTGAGPAPQTEPSASEGGAAPGIYDRTATDTGAAPSGEDDALLQRAARMIRVEIVEPARALPLLSCEDYRVVEAYGQVWERERGSRVRAQGSGLRATWWERLRGVLSGDASAPLRVAAKRGEVQVVELITAEKWVRFEDGKIIAAGRNSLGELPLVHIQNSVAAFEYAGASDVEPLIPLQDELNTRLSDRAHRITLQSFKMYLGKGIEAFTDQPVSPGRMWMTDNEQAQIQEFGGDASCPSEDTHISDLREALDKCSGVTPIAAGAIKNRIGRLTSAAALRVTLLALLSKTDKKRTLYGAGIERMCELALKWLDAAGVFKTSPEERRVELSWPSPLPENEMEKLTEAESKLRLGVDRAVVLRELGY
jgi:hypothetical protein